MKQLLRAIRIGGLSLGVITIITSGIILFNEVYFNTTFIIDSELAAKFGDFFGGFIGTLFSMLSILLLIYTVLENNISSRKNNLKDHFFKMIDYHNENVNQISIPHVDTEKKETENGRRAFVVYKIQLKRLIETIREINVEHSLDLDNKALIDISYIIFYYGLSPTWKEFVKDKLQRYKTADKIIDNLIYTIESNPKLKIGRTNQTNLSTYFRNMYNAIKLVDTSKVLSNKEKKELIKIYRAQLSNPELYVLFFNITSRFGKKWNEKEFVKKYNLIKNLPKDYCDGFNPKDFFDIKYEHESL